jgi:hypothetical protein
MAVPQPKPSRNHKRGATVEDIMAMGVIGALAFVYMYIFILWLAVLVIGGAALLALVLLIARRTRPAMITFATGLLCAAVMVALPLLGFLPFLDKESIKDNSKIVIVVIAVSLLLAGVGQFVAAFRSPRTYAAAFVWAVGSPVLLAAAAKAVGIVIPPSPNLIVGFAVGLFFLSEASLIVTVVGPRRRWLILTTYAILGGIAGFCAGDGCVWTRSTMFESRSSALPMKVEVYVLFVCVSAGTGQGGSSGVVLSNVQAAWLYGTPAAFAVAGSIAALGIAAWLTRQGNIPTPVASQENASV